MNGPSRALAGVVAALLLGTPAGGFSGGVGELIELFASDGQVLDGLGTSISLTQGTLVVGAPKEDDAGTDAGAAYVFEFVGGSWVQVAKLVPSSASPFDNIGFRVASGGDVVVLGAPCDDSGASEGGAAYVFQRSGSAWLEAQKLVSSDIESGDLFGIAVAVHEDTIVVGAIGDDDANPGNTQTQSGAAYIFRRVGASWMQSAKLVASDAAADDIFGNAVSIHGQTAVVAAEKGNNSSGAAYVFEASGSTWAETARLVAPGSPPDILFGEALAIHRDTIVCGAPLANEAYVFGRAGGTWSHEASLAYPTGLFGQFGRAVSVHEDHIVVGAGLDSSVATSAGAVFSFARIGTTWSHEASLFASDGTANDWLGFSVTLEGSLVFAGAPGDDSQGPQAGSVYGFGTGVGQAYCAGKTNSLGCIPFMTTLGQPSASGTGPFWLEGNEALPSEAGLLLYSFSKANLNFHGGKLCVKAPFFRLLPVKAAKNSGDPPCSGFLRRNFGNHIRSGVMPALTAGQVVFAQWRQRDTGDPFFGDGLTNAVRFEICP